MINDYLNLKKLYSKIYQEIRQESNIEKIQQLQKELIDLDKKITFLSAKEFNILKEKYGELK